jgi:putative ABC transport system permease protein
MGWYRRLRNLTRRDKLHRDIELELAFHVNERMDEWIASGMTPKEAKQKAMREFGNHGLHLERTRDMDIQVSLETFAKDLRYAVRGLLKSPGFALIAVMTLGLGIGANSAIFTVVNTFLIRPLPYPEPDRLVSLFERNVVGNEQDMSVAPGNFLDWQKTSTSFESMAASGVRILTLTSDAAGTVPERVGICPCSATLFRTLGVKPLLGRTFTAEEDRFGAPRLVVISYGLWQRRFAGADDVIGKSIRLDGDDHQVIGVMPRDFLFPHRIVEVWRPVLAGIPPQQQIRHDLHNFGVVARLRPGVSVKEAYAELDGIAAGYKKDHPDEATGKGANVIPLHQQLVQNVRSSLIVLLAAVGCVLLVACVNIASLLLARAASRTKEIGIRTALGAGRGRIVRQLLTESVILALAGGVVGAVLTFLIAGVLIENAPAAVVLVPAGSVPIDYRVFVFGFGIAALSGIGVGLFPAIRVSRANLASDLKSNGRSATSSRTHARTRNGLVAMEIALSVMLLIAFGLLFRSFLLLYQVRTGVRVDHTLTMNVNAPLANYREPAQRVSLLKEIIERLRSVPGVKSVGLTTCPPVSGSCGVLFYYVDGRPFVLGKVLAAMDRSVDPSYFEAAGIPLVGGRTFTERDGTGPDVNNPRLGSIVISESMAKTVFPGEDPIGKQIFFDFEVQRGRIQNVPVPHYQIIGVVGDVLSALDAQPSPTLYRPLLDAANAGALVLLHTAVEPKSVMGPAQDEIHRIGSTLAINRVQTMEELLNVSVAARQFNMMLFASFAALALLLAAIGLYGLVSHSVSQRTAEIGIRMALGASRTDVNRMVIRQGLMPAIAGVCIGLVAGGFAVRSLRSQLFGVTPADPATFVIVPIVLLAVAILACVLPALRATRLDPTVALRADG